MFACVGEEGGNWLANYLSLVQVIKKKNLQDCISTWYGKGQQSDLSVTLRWRDGWWQMIFYDSTR